MVQGWCLMEMELARRVELTLTIDGHDAAGSVAPYLKEFTFTDNAHGKADEVRLVLHNRDGKWSGPWKPAKGMDVRASIVCHDWEASGKDLSLPCGAFTIDEIECSGPPDSISIKAVSASLTTKLRDTDKTRAWENSSLKDVAGEVAQENGLSLMYDGDEHAFGRKDQRKESDLAFLCRMGGERGMNCKVHDGRLILFDAEKAEAQGPAMSIPKTGNQYSPKSYSFKESSSGTGYTEAETAYTDPATGTTHTATATAAGSSAAEPKTLTLHQREESSLKAMQASRAQLHKANTKEKTASMECMGCPRLVAGRTVELTGFGGFSGVYFIKAATHSLGGSQGYKTALELTARAAASSDGFGGEHV